jgi:hypothetical protein
MAVASSESRRGAYLGVGCLTAMVGIAGGAMIGVLVAKLVGAVRGCVADAETGAPCNWFVFAVYGALVGLIAVPSVAIWRMRVGERRALGSSNSEGG